MKRILVFAFFIQYGYWGFGQTQNEVLKQVNIASPTASELGKYVDVPVSYHTGVPNISIPVYTIKDGSITMPISLSYHAGGVKLAEVSSWVGLGWSLNAGGAISRSVNGIPDDRASLSNQVSGYFSEYGLENNVLYDSASPIEVGYLDDTRFIEGVKDGEPDLFSFNFNGYSGKFYFRDDRTPILVPQQDLKIITHTANNIHIIAFTIITPDGMKYDFGKTADTTDTDPVEMSNATTSSDPAINQNTISSWYLNKVTNPSGNKSVTLVYEQEKYTYFNISMPSLVGTNDSTYDHKLIKMAIKGVRLSEIQFSAGQVKFNEGANRTDVGAYVIGQDFYTETTNTEARTLGNVEITDGTDCKKFYFNYGYFEDTVNSLPSTLSITSHSIDKKRLKLLSVSERTCDSTHSNGLTTFNYFTEALPRRLNFGTDHWGFSNGAVNNTKVTSQYTIDTFNVVSGANREPKWPDMRAGTLKEIVYPTGGKTELEFEPHTTWVSSNVYNDTLLSTMNMGFDGGSTAVVQYHTLDANYHKFTIVNTNCPEGYEQWVTCLSSLRIYDSTTNQEVFYMTVPLNSTQSKVGYLPQGTYRFELFKDKGNYTGTGCYLYTDEMPAYTYSRNDTVGGLRIKKIKQYSNFTSSPVETNYSYNYSNNQSAGVLYSRPTYVLVLRNEQVKQIGVGGGSSCSPNGCINCDISSQLFYQKSGSPLVPMKNSQGNHIGYSQVKVSKQGNGYSIYKFFGSELWEDLHDDIAYKNVNLVPPCPASLPNWPVAPIPFEYKRGELKEEQYFNEESQILSEKWYSYNYENVPETFTTARIMSAIPGGGGGARITDYELMAKKKTKEEIISREYSMADGSILTTTDSVLYESPYHNSATKNIRFNSKGDTLVTKYKYALDFYKDTCQSISNCFTSFINDYNYYTSNYYYAIASGCGSENWSCKYNAWQTYRLNRVAIRKAYLACRASNYMNPANAYDSCITTAIASADTLLKPLLWLKEKGRNPVIETTTWRNSKLTGAAFHQYSLLNGSENQLYVKRIEQINLAEPSTTFQVSAVSGNSITKDSRYSTEVELKTENDNLLQVLPSNNSPLSYIWDHDTTYPVAEVRNALNESIAYTSFEADSKGGWTYSGSANSTYSITGKKSYLLSGGGISKSGLSSTTYTVSYWGKGGSVTVNSAGPTRTGETAGGWTYYEHDVTTTSVTVSGSNYIDELRLYPKTAQMKTYTYKPLVGISSVSDPNGNIVYYEYDKFFRLQHIRDQDSNVLKKFCYNYAGQPENCLSACTDSIANWQNIEDSIRCMQSGGNNTGYKEQKQEDINPCSPTYGNTQWINIGYDSTACPPSGNVVISYNNIANGTGYTAVYTKKSTTYTFNIPASGSGTLGSIPAGVYTLTITTTASPPPYRLFGSGCSTVSGTSATFTFLNVTYSSCNTVTIEDDL